MFDPQQPVQAALEYDRIEKWIALRGELKKDRTPWQEFWYRRFRKWSKEYRVEKAIRKQADELLRGRIRGLPFSLREEHARIAESVDDRKWFEVMYEIDLVRTMTAAAELAPAFTKSHWTIWDRRTFFHGHCQSAMVEPFRHFLDDLEKDGHKFPSLRSFPFHEFALYELRDIDEFIEILLGSSMP